MAMADADKTRTQREADPNRYSLGDNEKRRTQSEMKPERREWRSTGNYPSGMSKPITPKDVALENADKFYDKELPAMMGNLLLGEESDLPLPADMAVSAVPFGSMVDKMAEGKDIGLLDMPLASDIKSAALLLGVPMKSLFKAIGEHYLAKNAVAQGRPVSEFGDAFAKRMEKYPEFMQDKMALTMANREGMMPTGNVPPIGIGSDMKNRGYYKWDFGQPTPKSNPRVLNVNSRLDPDDAARQLGIEGPAGKAFSADYEKFNGPRAVKFGMEDTGKYGEQMGRDIGSSNKAFFNGMSNNPDRGVKDFLGAMSQDPALYRFYQTMMNPKLDEETRLALMGMNPQYASAVESDWWHEYPPYVLKFLDNLGGKRLSTEDMETLLSGGAKFGGLDTKVGEMFQPRWIRDDQLSGELFGRAMANYADEQGVPMLNPTLQKFMKSVEKQRDNRMPGNGITRSIDFNFLGQPNWKRKGY